MHPAQHQPRGAGGARRRDAEGKGRVRGIRCAAAAAAAAAAGAATLPTLALAQAKGNPSIEFTLWRAGFIVGGYCPGTSIAALATGRWVHDIAYWDNAMGYDGRVAGWGHALQAAGHCVESMGKLHHAMMGTASVAIATAAAVPGPVVNAAAGGGTREVLVFGHPSGTLRVGADVKQVDGSWVVTKAVMSRSARVLMEGAVRVPGDAF